MKSQIKSRKVLMDAGYNVGNLWHIDEVKDKFSDISDQDAQDILDEVLTSDWIVQRIQERIYDIGTDREYNEKD